MVGAEEDEFPGVRFHACLIEDGLEWHAGPASVARKALRRPAVARALEAEDELCALHLLEDVEREFLRPIDEPVDLQAIARRIDLRVTVMLRREELIARRERTVDGAD